jgi:hypothetical protein
MSYLEMSSHHTIPGRTARHSRHRGFTLLEAALTTMIVGVGLVAMLQLLAAGTSANLEGNEMTTGVNLAKSVRELTLKMTFNDVLGLDGRTYSPPVDSRGVAIAGFGDWTQNVDVQAVDRDRLTLDIVEPTPQVVRVTVSVTHNAQPVCDVSWYRFKPMP